MNIQTQNKIELKESFIPGTLDYKKFNKKNAEEVLLYAKSLNRKVRRAEPNECEFSREITTLKEENDNELITTEQVAKLLGKSNYVVFQYRNKGVLKVHSNLKQFELYSRTEVMQLIDSLNDKLSESWSLLEASKYVGISLVCLRDYIFKGKLNCFKISAKKYIKIEDVKEFKETYFKNT